MKSLGGLMPNDSKSLPLKGRVLMGEAGGSFKSLLTVRTLTSGWSLALIGVGLLWLIFFNAVRGEWQINPQYSYGYIVPFMGAVLLWRRWQDRPDVSASSSRWKSSGVVAGILLLLYLPWMIALEANPEWRLLYWISGFQAVGLSLCLIAGVGGWRWVVHFVPALVFMLIAAPWPMGMEQSVIQGLMRLVAALTVEVVGLIGIPALQHGNLIEIGTGVVGIDEACSGIRSLQSALMLSLFLGEANRFGWGRRIALLGASLVFVLFANLGRTTFLVWAAVNRGFHQMEAWHDTAGNLVMVIVLPSLLGLAYWLKPKMQSSPDHSRSLPVAPPFSIPRWIGIGVVLWIVLGHVMTELWYQTHEASLISNRRWTIAWPSEQAQFRKTAIPERSLAILRCSSSDSATWQDNAGNTWSGFLLRWEPGKNSAQLAKGHRPDICFPASGARLAEDFGSVTVRANDVELPFRHQSFEMGNGLVHVFYCLWSDRRGVDEKGLLEDGSEASRLQAIRAGKRHLGQQVLELAVKGPRESEDAIEQLRQIVPELIRLEQTN